MVYELRGTRIAPKSILRTLGLVLLLSILVARGFPAQVHASPETTGVGVSPPGILSLANAVGDDNFATIDLTSLLSALDPAGTQHYGPYPSGSTDSGTCGNDWANDMFDRHFTVHGTFGSYSIVEQFKDGSFVTPASDSPPTNFSPGACQNSLTPQGIVNDGIRGSLHGYFVIPLPPTEAQTSSSPFCDAVAMTNAGCTTTTFIDTHFTPCYFGGSGSCPVTTFFFHYAAGDQGLIDHEWKNASPDRGGNNGDIRSSNLP
jgi:hypothetical protein